MNIIFHSDNTSVTVGEYNLPTPVCMYPLNNPNLVRINSLEFELTYSIDDIKLIDHDGSVISHSDRNELILKFNNKVNI